MSVLVLANNPVSPIYQYENGSVVYPRIAGAAFTTGQAAYQEIASGRLLVADAAASAQSAQFRGIVLETRAAYQGVSLFMHGLLGGFNLDAIPFDALIYLDVNGTLNTVANATKTVPVARVVGTGVGDNTGAVRKALLLFTTLGTQF